MLHSYRFGRFEVRPAQRVVLVDGKSTNPGARAFDVLMALLHHRDRVVSKDELLDLAWPGLVVEENNLQAQVSALRKLLGPQAIVTIPGRGYRFALEASDAAPDIAQPPLPPPPSAPQPNNTHLPLVLTPLIGRTHDVSNLGNLMGQHRLLTIVGAGGIGKSLLAQWLLHERRGAHQHGVAWVDLASQTSPEFVASTVAGALGLQSGHGDPLKGLMEAVRPLSMLIAIDNAEHLLDEVARILQALHQAAPQLQVLVTSQAPLKLANEWVYRLDALALPERATTLDEARNFGAVALFAQRAQAADRRFELGPQNLATVVEICRRLDGLPLAIELAAARVPLLGLVPLANSLNERLRLLNGGGRGAPARQKTLRAALEWSYGLLDASEQTVFRRLGVFVGGFSLEMAQQVVADKDLDAWAVVDVLGALVDRSLVIADGGDTPRYRLLDTPRSYALEQLAAAGEDTALRQRHAQAMRHLFEQADRDFFSGKQRIDDWYVSLAPDLSNGHEALSWAIQHDPHTAVAIAPGLAEALTSDRRRERRFVWQATALLVTDQLPADLQARWSSRAAYFWAYRQPALACRLARRAATLYRAQPGEQRNLYHALAALVYALTYGPEQRQEQREVLAEMWALEDPAWPPIVRSYGLFASLTCNFIEGRFDQAIEQLLQKATLDALAGYSEALLRGEDIIAYMELAAGRVDASISRYLALQARLAGTRHMATLLLVQLHLTGAWLAKGDTQQARALLETCWPQVLHFDAQVYAADNLALLAALESRPHTASRLLGYADTVHAAHGKSREVNEARCAECAEHLVRQQLDAASFERLKTLGTGLRHDDIAALALGRVDAV
ncbi:putative ATPase/DNA-binding winged helix-turn-helix (wHTH) protein [Rhodoferax ferrireducens]|uniref:ATPase/DNA-binding winged helix-turn-helix (WHTH) protein n=1 Tax=Rhodoferax ferrireducens TaxID=192843 RepID=A0ABU2CAQ4_9BURK|nr:winged helix-turn-helix domain-containing protein [Rhodoferax ferrireducens]MDR7378379.1 putative ATPase/DNA-binding winged helix-turn-helix (wHTH) protein [Rhodoferax ferrireducens]